MRKIIIKKEIRKKVKTKQNNFDLYATKSKHCWVIQLFFLQGVLLHPNGEVRKASSVGGRQERRRLARGRRFGTLPSAEPTLQQKQSHRGMGPAGS